MGLTWQPVICAFHPQHVSLLMTCAPTNFNLMEYLKGHDDLLGAGVLQSTDTHITWSTSALFDAVSLNLESKQHLFGDVSTMAYMPHNHCGFMYNSITLNP